MQINCINNYKSNMNFNQFTIKAQEAVQKAIEIAVSYQNQPVDTIHILKGMLTVDENAIPFLLKKLNVNVQYLNQTLDKKISELPKVAGGNPYLSSEANNALLKANSFLKEFSDEFVSLEHLLLGILGNNDTTSKLLKENGVTEKD